MHEPLHIDDQASSLREWSRQQTVTKSKGPVYQWAVTSGKGGVGKSVFALNFALSLIENGRTVLLVDADENLGKLDVMLGQSPKYRIPDVMSGTATVQDAVVEPIPGCFLLAGSSGSMDYPEITETERKEFIVKVTEALPQVTDVVVDTAAGIQPKVVSYAASADEVIVVSHHEPVAILDAYAVIKMVNARNASVRIDVVMNRSTNVTECDEAASKLQKAVRHFLAADVQYLGVVPYDETVGRSIVQQRPLVRIAPNASSALCIRSIARALASRRVPARNKHEMVYA